MTPDPKWLEILKASGWQTTAIAAECGVIFFSIRVGALPPPGDAWVVSIAGAGIVCGFLSIASILSGLLKFFSVSSRIRQFLNDRQCEKEIEEYIPHMTEHEHAIIAYLLKRNQKTFTCDSDGGYANTLLSRGIVRLIGQRGQQIMLNDVPAAIPDTVWNVLVKHKDKFESANSNDDTHPWRVPWMLR